MIIAQAINDGEVDILKGNESAKVTFTDLDGTQVLLVHDAPREGWTHAALAAMTTPTHGWNAKLGTQWIGSSEI